MSSISLKDHAERIGAWLPVSFGMGLLTAYNSLVGIPPNQDKALYFLRPSYDHYQVIFVYYLKGKITFDVNDIRPLERKRFRVDRNFYLKFKTIENLVGRVFENNIRSRVDNITLTPLLG